MAVSSNEEKKQFSLVVSWLKIFSSKKIRWEIISKDKTMPMDVPLLQHYYAPRVQLAYQYWDQGQVMQLGSWWSSTEGCYDTMPKEMLQHIGLGFPSCAWDLDLTRLFLRTGSAILIREPKHSVEAFSSSGISTLEVPLCPHLQPCVAKVSRKITVDSELFSWDPSNYDGKNDSIRP